MTIELSKAVKGPSVRQRVALQRLSEDHDVPVEDLWEEGLRLVARKYEMQIKYRTDCLQCATEAENKEQRAENKAKAKKKFDDRVANGLCGKCGRRELAGPEAEDSRSQYCPYCYSNAKEVQVSANVAPEMSDFVQREIKSNRAAGKSDVVRYAMEVHKATMEQLAHEQETGRA